MSLLLSIFVVLLTSFIIYKAGEFFTDSSSKLGSYINISRAVKGTTIDEFPFDGVSGLAWSPNGGPMGNGSLWVVANTPSDLVTELDPNNGWAELQSFVIPDGVQYSGAGLEIDASGALWVVNQQNEVVYLVDSGIAYEVPLSNWALLISIVLIIGFVAIRQTRIFG